MTDEEKCDCDCETCFDGIHCVDCYLAGDYDND